MSILSGIAIRARPWIGVPPAMSRTRVLSVLGLMAVAAILFLGPNATAGKPGSTVRPGSATAGSGRITLLPARSADGLVHHSQTVTFDAPTAVTDQPWVNLKCWQGKTLVADEWDGFFPAALTGRDFDLSSPSWAGGGADCTAYLTTPQWVVLASTSFHVST